MEFDLGASYSNANWFRARRLLQKDTEEAKKEFEEMDRTEMVEVPDIGED